MKRIATVKLGTIKMTLRLKNFYLHDSVISLLFLRIHLLSVSPKGTLRIVLILFTTNGRRSLTSVIKALQENSLTIFLLIN